MDNTKEILQKSKACFLGFSANAETDDVLGEIFKINVEADLGSEPPGVEPQFGNIGEILELLNSSLKRKGYKLVCSQDSIVKQC